MNKIVIYKNDDWCCLYVNGKSEFQGHKIPEYIIANFYPAESIEEKCANDVLNDFVLDSGNFPDTLEECERISNHD